MKILIPVLLTCLAACSLFSGITRLDEMTDAEYGSYLQRASAQVGVIAAAAIAEEKVSEEAIDAVANGLRSLAAGTTTGVGGVLTEVLGLDSLEAVVLVIVLTELDAKLSEMGAYEDDGALSPRARGVYLAVADALDPPS